MSTTIKDGTGTGNQVEVNTNNQLSTVSESLAKEEAETVKGETFVFHGRCHTAAATSGGLLTIENTSTDKDIVITRMYIDAFILTPLDLVITQIFGAASSGGTDISSTGIIQKNRGSALTLDAKLTISDAASDITLTGGTEYHSWIMTSGESILRDMVGTNLIPPGKFLSFGYERAGGGSASDGEIISFSINCYRGVNGS